jgi:8-oxo-dGTP diphosphatase
MPILVSKANPFGGTVIDPAALPSDPEEFRIRLAHSLAAWRGEGIRVVWLEVPIDRAVLIPTAVAAGFVFHHAAESYAMLTARIFEGAFIPPYATHYTGAGGVVVNEKRELLVVCERHRRTREPAYKLPGGALHPGEDLQACVQREILEETGIRTDFQALVALRHWHGYRYGKSDIYFICRLAPLNQDITRQTEEIEECLWMPLDEYLASPYVHAFNRRVVEAALMSPGIVPARIEGYSDSTREIFLPSAP